MVIVMLGRVGAFSLFHLSVVCVSVCVYERAKLLFTREPRDYMLTCRGLWDIGLMSV